MKVFLTGATGFIGTALIPELLQAGHQVLGLTRSESGAQALRAAGVEPHAGNIEDLDSLRTGAAQADAVIHCGFNHDFSRFLQNCLDDQAAIVAMGEVLLDSKRPMLVTSGVGIGIPAPGQLAVEDVLNTDHPNPRTASELKVQELVARGANIATIRLPQVHDTHKQGLITYAINISREKGKVAYIGEGLTRYSAAHVSDVAHLYRLALEKATPGARYNAVAEEGVTVRDIMEVIGHGMNLPVQSLTPEEAAAHYGWMSMFMAYDLPASSTLTRQALNWTPTGPTLLTDLANMNYAPQP